jgi:hypothetical protein
MKRSLLLSALGAFLLLPLMASTQSLWIDEGDTAVYALQPDLRAWLDHLLADPNADCQMPLSMFLAWLLALSGGTSEWALRAPNLLWGAGTLGIFFWIGRKERLPLLPAVMALQPFFWFYIGEARPYALQIFCGSLLLWGLRLAASESEEENRRAVPVLAAGAVLLAHATLLAPLTLAFVFAAAAFLLARQRSCWIPRRPEMLTLGLGALACVPIGAYYLHTILRGAAGAQLWKVGPAALGYVFYELFGFAGLGPAPAALRELSQGQSYQNLLSGYPGHWLLVGVLAAAYAAALLPGLLRKWPWRRDPGFWCLALVPILATVAFILLGALLQKPFWARHLAPLFPLGVYLGTVLAVETFRTSPTRFRTVAGWGLAGLLALLAVSSARIRWGADFERDNYREAARQASQALQSGKAVWWAASWHCAYYYGLPVDAGGTSTRPEFGMLYGSATSSLTDLAAPQLAVLGKPDVYDRDGAIRKSLSEKGLHPREKLPGLELYRP